MNPSSGEAAGKQASALLKYHLRGAAHATKRRRFRTAELIAERIWNRWHVGPWRWRQKHIRWYLEVRVSWATDNTRYQHFLVLRDIVRILGREGWLDHVIGPWVRPSRPVNKQGSMPMG